VKAVLVAEYTEAVASPHHSLNVLLIVRYATMKIYALVVQTIEINCGGTRIRTGRVAGEIIGKRIAPRAVTINGSVTYESRRRLRIPGSSSAGRAIFVYITIAHK
jgi:hypothetical protein